MNVFTCGPVSVAVQHIHAVRVEGQEGMAGKYRVSLYTSARAPLQLMLTMDEHDQLIEMMTLRPAVAMEGAR